MLEGKGDVEGETLHPFRLVKISEHRKFYAIGLVRARLPECSFKEQYFFSLAAGVQLQGITVVSLLQLECLLEKAMRYQVRFLEVASS